MSKRMKILIVIALVVLVVTGTTAYLLIKSDRSSQEIANQSQALAQPPIFGFKATAAFGGEYGKKQLLESLFDSSGAVCLE